MKERVIKILNENLYSYEINDMVTSIRGTENAADEIVKLMPKWHHPSEKPEKTDLYWTVLKTGELVKGLYTIGNGWDRIKVLYWTTEEELLKTLPMAPEDE